MLSMSEGLLFSRLHCINIQPTICIPSVQEMSDSRDFIHFPGLNYCGPGTDLEERLESDGETPKARYRPVDRIDEASLRHDIYYREHPSERESA